MRNFTKRWCTTLLGTALALSGVAAAAPAEEHPSAAAEIARIKPEAAAPELALATKQQRLEWHQRMLHEPRKSGACYTANYPDPAWHEAPCTAPPKHFLGPQGAMAPRRLGSSLNADIVGNGTDFVAEPSSPITSAEGSFDTVTGATSVQTQNAGAGGSNGANLWTLQLNSNFFTTSLCKNLGPNCQGFAQFAYDNQPRTAFVQFWLVNLTGACPSGWTSAVGDCVQTAPASPAFASTPTATDLAEISVTGSAASGVTVLWGGNMITAPGNNIIPDLASNWGDAEFNIFGDGGGGEAVFNSGVTMTVRTQVDTGINIIPNCVTNGWTGETNNLNLVSTPSASKAQFPSIVFDQSFGESTTPASCSTSVGDTHVTTFDGLYYDFQASGEFVLADTGPDFIVQARQESGAKVFNNPNVTMNTAVAVRMGSSQVVIYDNPVKITVNGKTTEIANNEIVTLPENVLLMRLGSLYALTRTNGDLVRAQLFNGWMDITVGLGHRTRANAHGILASPTRTALSLRNGTRLAEPVAASDLYQRYAKSWVVQANESLFNEHLTEFAAPLKPISVTSLDRAAQARARKACTAAGVIEAAHLDSCVLDAVVFKDDLAIRTFTHAIPPKTTFKPVELR